VLHHPSGDGTHFGHRTVGSQVAEKDGQASRGAVRVLQRADDFPVADLRLSDVLAQGLAGDCEAVQVQGAGFSAQLVQDGADAAGLVLDRPTGPPIDEVGQPTSLGIEEELLVIARCGDGTTPKP